MTEQAPRELPFVRRAFIRILEELPHVGTGLSRLEAEVLEALRGPPLSSAALVVAVSKLERPWSWWMGDLAITNTARRMARFRLPLLRMLRSSNSGGQETLQFCIAQAGRQTLEGGFDHAEMNAISSWVGGAYLFRRPRFRWGSNDREGREIVWIPPARGM